MFTPLRNRTVLGYSRLFLLSSPTSPLSRAFSHLISLFPPFVRGFLSTVKHCLVWVERWHADFRCAGAQPVSFQIRLTRFADGERIPLLTDDRGIPACLPSPK